jgi:surfeit locus 1 family protein
MRTYSFGLTLMHLAIIMAVLGLCKLGWWQIHRGQQHFHQQQQAQRLRNRAPLRWAKNHPPAWPTNRQLIIQGHYQNKAYILLDNQLYQHYVGYHVLTPLAIQSTLPWVLVDRGWIPHHAQDNQLPEPIAMHHLVTLQGIISYPQKGLSLATTPTPHLITHINLHRLAKRWHHPLMPFVLVLNAQQPGAYLNTWHAQTTHNPWRNYGYAGQFFALALILAITYIIVQTKRR